jgi:hypothetical protein
MGDPGGGLPLILKQGRAKNVSRTGEEGSLTAANSTVMYWGMVTFFTGRHSLEEHSQLTLLQLIKNRRLVSQPFMSFHNCHPLLPSQDSRWFSRSDTFLLAASCHKPLMFVLYPQRWWTPLTLKHTASCEKNPVFTLE